MKTDLDRFKELVERLIQNPAKLKRIAQKAGIITSSGKLTKPYKL